jgi:hypothetical protein
MELEGGQTRTPQRGRRTRAKILQRSGTESPEAPIRRRRAQSTIHVRAPQMNPSGRSLRREGTPTCALPDPRPRIPNIGELALIIAPASLTAPSPGRRGTLAITTRTSRAPREGSTRGRTTGRIGTIQRTLVRAPLIPTGPSAMHAINRRRDRCPTRPTLGTPIPSPTFAGPKKRTSRAGPIDPAGRPQR